MARLTIHLLGTFHIAVDGIPVTGFESEKARALLAYLAVESDRDHRRERLAGLLWPDFPERRARQNLSQALSNIRAVIGDRIAHSAGAQTANGRARTPFLDVTHQTIRLNPLAETWVDVEELAGCRTVLPRESAGGELPWSTLSNSIDPSILERLEQTEALYRGCFLDGFSLGGCAEFEEWCVIQRERYDRLVLAGLRVLTAGYVKVGDPRRALTYAWKQLEVDRWREEVHRQVMALLAMTGQRSAALAQYGACRRMLADEIGVDPEPATLALVEKIRSGALGDEGRQRAERGPPHSVDAGARPRDHPAAVARRAVRRNLPAQLMPCIGREREVAEILRLLTAGSCCLITLVGPGGIGKTRLALEVANHLTDAKLGPALFPDGVFFVPLAGAASADAIVPMIARELGLASSATGGELSRGGSGAGEPLEARLLAYLRDKRMLLVLDNFEHLMAGTVLTTELLQAATGLRLLVTSRARLNALSECLYPVTALALPDLHAVGAVEQGLSGAVALFAWSAGRLRPALRLEGDALQDAVSICHEVGGMPLGVLLAAAWLTVLAPAEIHRQLSGSPEPAGESGVLSPSLDFLRSEWPDIPERQRSMRRVFERSWRLLTPEERSVFRGLSVFRDGFTRAAARQVAGAGLHDLRSLVDKSLVACSLDGRYEMHELLRQFAAEKLALESAPARAIKAEYAAFYVSALEVWYEGMKGPRQQDVLGEMDVEIGNVRAAWEGVVASGDVTGIARAVDGISLYYARRVRWEEGRAACVAAAASLDALQVEVGSMTCAWARASARVAHWLCELGPDEAIPSSAEPALAIIDRRRVEHGTEGVCDLRLEKAALLSCLADYQWYHDRPEARRLYERALELAREAGDRWLEGTVLHRLGCLEWAVGELAAAQSAGEASLKISRELGDLRGIRGSLQALSGVAMMTGNLDESAHLSEQCLEIAEELGDPLQTSNSSYTLGFKYVLLGRSEEAVALMHRCQSIERDLGLADCRHYSVEGWAHSLAGDHVRGRALQEEALEVWSRGEGARERAWILMMLGRNLIAQAYYAEAASVLEESVETYRPLGQLIEFAMSLCSLGLARCKLGQAALARSLLAESLSIGVATGAHMALVCALPDVALLWAEAGRCSEAAALYRTVARVSAWPRVSPWYQTVFGEPLAALCPGEDHLDLATDDSPENALSALMRAGREVLAELQEGGGDEERGGGGGR